MIIESVPLDNIIVKTAVLRRVNKISEGYLGLKASIEKFGFFGTILVREVNGRYQLIDGLYRVTALRELGHQTVNVDCVECGDVDLLYMQTVANLNREDTTPTEYTEQILRILNLRPELTEMELASCLGRSYQWVQDRLSLTNIVSDHVKLLIDEGNMNLANAFVLAKLPAEEQETFVVQAMSESPNEFSKKIRARIKHLKESKKKKKKPKKYVFKPVPYMKPFSAITKEIETGKVAKRKGYVGAKAKGFDMALKWVMHLDPEGLAQQREKYEMRQQLKDKAKAQIEAERERKLKDLENQA